MYREDPHLPSIRHYTDSLMRVGACVAAMVVARPDVAVAQPRGEWHGRVLADSSHQPIQGARLSASVLGLAALSDSLGRFVLPGLPAGGHVVVATALGYRPDTTTIDVGEGEAVFQDIKLRRVATSLEEVRVTAPTSRYVRGKMVEFEHRKADGIGTFIERDLLERNRTRRTSDILASHGRGVDVRRGTRSKAWAVSGRAVGSGKCALCNDRGRTLLDPSDAAAGAGAACYMDVWLDGVLAYNSASRGAPLFDLNSINPDDIEAIEVYASAAQMPAKFNHTSSGCGALVIWTRI